MMSNGRMVKSLKLKLRIFGALAGMTSLLITLLPTYVQAETWTEDSDPNNYVMEDLPLSGGGTGTLVKEYKGTATVLKIPAQLGSKTVVLQPGFKLSDTVEKLNVSIVKPKDPTDIRKLFEGCPKVKQIIFQEGSNTFDTHDVTDMSGLFEGCEALSALDLSSLDTHAVTNMSRMFKGCKELQTLGLVGTFDTAQVTDMSEMFRDCERLDVLDLSNFDLSGITPETNIADFLTGTKPSTIKSPKTNPLEDKIALPVSAPDYYKDVTDSNKKLTKLPKTTGTPHELNRVVEVTNLTLDTTQIELQMGDTKGLQAAISPNEATDKGLKWEVLNSGTTTVSEDICEKTVDMTDATKCTIKAKKAGKATVKVSSLSNPDKFAICEVTVKPGYHAGVTDGRSDTPGGNVSATAEGEGFAVSVGSGATEMQKAVESGQNYKNPYMVSYFNLKVTKNGNPVSESDFQPVTVTIPLPQSMNALVAKAKPTLLRLGKDKKTPYEEAAEIRQEAGNRYSITFTLKKGDQTDPETQYALIYKTNPDGSANGSSGSSNSASGTSGAIIVNVSPTPITVNVQAGSSSSANSSNSSSNGSSNGSVIIYQNPNGINGGNVIRTLGGGGINGMDMPKTADSMSIRYRTLGAMIMALLGALLFLSSFLVGGMVGNQPALAVSAESRKKRRFEADEDSRWLE